MLTLTPGPNDGTILSSEDNDGSVGLEPSWKMKFDLATEQFYFYNEESLKTQWEKPGKNF